MKNALMLAFHFPPMQGSSGLQRTLKFCQYLPANDWSPAVLTVNPRVYPDVSDDLVDRIPEDLEVVRAFALDASKHMSVFGRYPSVLAVPDRWVSWLIGGLVSGLRMIRANKPGVMWSTFPVGTTHLLGLLLHRISGVPWVVDIRDPMVEEDYPPDRMRRAVLSWIERKSVQAASRIVVTTEGTARRYREKYPDAADRVVCIPNGYDEKDFLGACDASSSNLQLPKKPFTLLHSGIVYLSERDPSGLFEAISIMLRDGSIGRGDINFVFRACRNEAEIGALAAQHGVDDIVELLPPIAYEDALREMNDADGLMILQGANCNDQVPAKVFEYMRFGKPVLALADPAGDTAKIIRDSGVDYIAPLENPAAMAVMITRIVRDIDAGNVLLPDVTYARSFSREAQTAALSAVFDAVGR